VAKLSVAIVAHPHKRAAAGVLWERTLAALEARAEVRAVLQTRGGSGDASAIAATIGEARPDVVIAAGGDGTVGAVVRQLCARSDAAPALGILALGTANNFARTLGLPAYRQRGAAAADTAVAAICGGARQRIDVGCAGEWPFAGSFALGLDAEILALRNRLRRYLRLPEPLAGYPLYLASCAAAVLRQPPLSARLSIDGCGADGRFLNLLVTNAPLYAGEFRFDGAPRLDDGLLELQIFADRAEYLSGYVAAWRRHLRHRGGQRVAAPRRLQRVRRIEIAFPERRAAQIDGEMGDSARDFVVEVLPRCIEVCVAPTDSPPA
jgi:diacylglycerol kinase (ATP)